MATISTIKKGLVSMFVVLAGLGITKAAFAADCQPTPLVKVDGVVTSEISPVVIHGSGKLTVRYYCDEDKTTAVASQDSAMSRTKDVPKAEWAIKTGGLRVKILNAYTEFEGTLSGKIGETRAVTFKDGSGATYTVNVQFADSYAGQSSVDALGGRVKDVEENKADKKDVYTRPESDGRFAPIGASYTKPESDDRYAPKGTSFGNDGRTRLELQPLAFMRTGGYDAAFGLAGMFTYHVGPANETAFEFAVFGGYARGRLDVRPVQGVPLAEDTVYQDVGWVGALFGVGVPLGSRVDLGLGGGPFFRFLHVPTVDVGQRPNGQVWAWHAQNDTEGGLALNLDLRFHLTGDERRGVYLGLGTTPQIPFMKSYKTDGGDKNTYAAAIDAHGTIGGRF